MCVCVCNFLSPSSTLQHPLRRPATWPVISLLKAQRTMWFGSFQKNEFAAKTFFFFLPFTLSWLRETVRVVEGAIIFLWHLSVTEKPDSFPGGSVGKESACSAGDPSSIPGLGRSAGEGIGYPLQYSWASLVAQLVKNPPAVWDTWVRPLGWEDPLEKGKLPAPVFRPGEFHGLYTWSFSATRFSSQEPLPDASDSWSRCVQQQSHLHWEN